MIRRALAACGGNRAEAARRLGIHRQLLYEKMRRYGLEPSGNRTGGVGSRTRRTPPERPEKRREYQRTCHVARGLRRRRARAIPARTEDRMKLTIRPARRHPDRRRRRRRRAGAARRRSTIPRSCRK